jgi:cell division protein FtsI (penicillin-binding protein 3)
MKSVAHAGGTGTLAAIPGIEVAGKTGTAEKVDPVTHRYSSDIHLSSFVGFAPADAPSIVAMVVLDEPKGKAFGGMVAAPAWRRIVEHALVERGVLASATLERGTFTPAAPAPEEREMELLGDVHGTDDVVSDGTHANAPVTAGSAPRDEGAPDLHGLGARAAMVRAESAGLDVSFAGSGVVVAQVPPPGAHGSGPLRVLLADADSLDDDGRVDAATLAAFLGPVRVGASLDARRDGGRAEGARVAKAADTQADKRAPGTAAKKKAAHP